MQYIWEAGKRRRVMHVQRHDESGRALWGSLCRIEESWQPVAFNRSINAPFALGRRVCRRCLRRIGPS